MLACFAVAFLSSLLSERTRSTETELLAMEDHVRRVDKLASLGEMAAGLAHEIKNPLASLSGSIQLLQQDTDCGTADNRLMLIILRESERLNTLVSEFLLFAKPAQDSIEIIQLDHELAEIITLFKNDSDYRDRIDIATELVPGFKVAMDPAQLRQVLWNILLNAADAIDKQGHVIIKMYPLRRRHVCITITDDGCGMSHETVKKIFDPFFTTKASGTGLGLSIVHSTLQSYNGWLGVYSQLGKGTTFTLNLKRLV
jgi:two-component system sensor histidine kinase PilS (NtrC family)